MYVIKLIMFIILVFAILSIILAIVTQDCHYLIIFCILAPFFLAYSSGALDDMMKNDGSVTSSETVILNETECSYDNEFN